MSTGFFGKLPAMGDFVTRRLPQDFVAPWDAWLATCVQTSRDELGEDWLACYLTSPLWRFALGPGVAGEARWLGVLMPSVDRAGRYFPLTVAAAWQATLADTLRGEADAWFDGVESLALSSLEPEFDFDGFDASLASLAPNEAPDTVANEPDAPRGASCHIDLGPEPAKALEDAAPVLAEIAFQQAVGGYALWWTTGSERVAPALLSTRGLPDTESYASMLDGRFDIRGWQSAPNSLAQ